MAKNKNDVPVSTARFRLNATLQDLVEKKDDGLSDDEESGSQSEAAMRGPSSPFSSPSKRSSYSRSTGRKRKRKDDVDGFETDHYHHTFVMKLFDRSVDLAQFEESTPLYPICRAWMRNKPRSKEAPRQRSPSPDITSLSDEEAGNVYQLPQPVFVKMEDSDDRDIRIPSPVPQTDPSLDINADPDTAPPPEQLLLNHMARWKLTREKWRVASLRNEDRFAPSMNILRDMFEQQMKESC